MSPAKRVVLEHTQPPLAGLRTIVGLDTEITMNLLALEFVAFYPRYTLYRERAPKEPEERDGA